MKLAQVRPQQLVFNPRQDLVADEFVWRHPTLQGAHASEHAGAEYGRCFASPQRLDQRGKAFGSILSVSMHQGHEIKTVFDGVMETELLVATVSLVHGIEKHMKRERRVVFFFYAKTAREGGVLGSIVNDEHFHLVQVGEFRRDAAHHAADGLLGVVGNNENQDARLVTVQQDLAFTMRAGGGTETLPILVRLAVASQGFPLNAQPGGYARIIDG